MDRRSCRRREARPGRALGLALAALVVGGLAGVGPVAAQEAMVPRGEQIYEKLCVSCHGRYGRGDGPLAESLTMPVPDFTRTPVGAGLTDDQLIARLMGRDAEGHAPMAIGTLLPESLLRDAVAYMRRLSRPGGGVSVVAGRDVYEAACWVCHGRDGRGDGPVAKTLPGPKPRDFTSDTFVVEGREQEVADIVGMGAEKAFHGSEYMPEWSKRLSPTQIRDVVEYLKTFHHEAP